MLCLHQWSNYALQYISCHTPEQQGTMASRQFGNNCHALLTNIKRTVCFPLLSSAVLYTAVSLALYGPTTAGRGTVINGRRLQASHCTLGITACCTELKDQFSVLFVLSILWWENIDKCTQKLFDFVLKPHRMKNLKIYLAGW